MVGPSLRTAAQLHEERPRMGVGMDLWVIDLPGHIVVG
jgi:hypothetical protein